MALMQVVYIRSIHYLEKCQMCVWFQWLCARRRRCFCSSLLGSPKSTSSLWYDFFSRYRSCLSVNLSQVEL